MKPIIWTLTTILLLATSKVFASNDDILISRANRFFSSLSEAMPGSDNDTPERIALGKKLYFEKRLSINDKQACASCHKLDDGFAGVDNLPVSPGAKGDLGTRNSPTVLTMSSEPMRPHPSQTSGLLKIEGRRSDRCPARSELPRGCEAGDWNRLCSPTQCDHRGNPSMITVKGKHDGSATGQRCPTTGSS